MIMSDASSLRKDRFQFGSTTVGIIQGDIMVPGVDVDAVVSTDDNHLTMSSGVARLLANAAGPYYMRAAQAQCPVKAGTAVVTRAYRLPEHGLNVKYVLHGTVVDYDTYDLPLDQVVYKTTANCLVRAEGLGLSSILFPAFATGACGLAMETCAHQMCSAIKVYLAQERPIRAVYVVLYLPQDAGRGDHAPAGHSRYVVRNQRFIRGANLVLGVPYNPVLGMRQSRDFYGRDGVIQRLEAIITGAQAGKRHAVILGGSRIGKSVLLDHLHNQAKQPGSPLSEGRRVFQVTFGRVHKNTPASFIYRKFLLGLRESEDDAQVLRKIRRAYADTSMDRHRFLKFLKDHSDHYPEVVFLVDHLPRLLKMGAEDFWCDLDRLEGRVRFIFTATDGDQYQALRDRLGDGFKSELEEIGLKCVEEPERRAWVDALYQCYLDRTATDPEHDFIEEEAGRHPYLISLVCHALVEALKRDALINPTHPAEYNQGTLAPYFHAARNTIAGPRRAFFDLLMGPSLGAEDRGELRSLAEAVVIEEERERLLPDLRRGDRDAIARLQELQREEDPRLLLHDERLRRLGARGYLVDTDSPATAQFMAQSFKTWVAEYFGVGRSRDEDDQPRDVVISLLSPEPQVISTLFRGRGARIVTAQKRLLAEVKTEFIDSFGDYISHRLRPARYPASDRFKDLEQVGNYILTQFATGTIKSYLQNPPQGSTILLVVQDVLKDIPWELMLETAYTGEIPFLVGRSIVSPQQPSNINPPVRGDGKIKALLIGDPTDDLDEARAEVQRLADLLRNDGRFTVDDEDILIGSGRCQRIPLLNALGSGEYGLIHYSGHSRFDGYQSAWQLKDGKNITTDMLTNGLQMAPPALVFSSSCESAVGEEPGRIKYEDQTFDLPSAFLQAGVEAYVGTLWAVESSAARWFVEEFYSVFLSGEADLCLGECLRRAKWACKQRGDGINWVSFILYGDPHTGPGDLFPVLDEQDG